MTPENTESVSSAAADAIEKNPKWTREELRAYLQKTIIAPQDKRLLMLSIEDRVLEDYQKAKQDTGAADAQSLMQGSLGD